MKKIEIAETKEDNKLWHTNIHTKTIMEKHLQLALD